ncbi:Putative transposase [Aromatoleum petrolei]|nr:Putative transposase [Aromatoleum petrolei]
MVIAWRINQQMCLGRTSPSSRVADMPDSSGLGELKCNGV